MQNTVVSKNTVITLSYVMYDDDSGKILEFRDDMRFLHDGAAELLPKLHEAVNGYSIGMSCGVLLTEDDAFGAYDPQLLVKDEKTNFPSCDIKVGSTIEGHTESGEILIFRIVDIDGEVVTADANHPLAGINLRFELKVKGIRQASAVEIERGKAIKLTSHCDIAKEQFH
ncbi:hypothetical protein MNBD_GAMMA22-445 [hydrothermal vent metagenome]|uniref:peptidylprolyl isomerase n=1 Tax=hydrothermal vent metagenome TaxID=652676 RepID=A0A3B1B793_9ZZZZ